jgi:hypothetical protein
MMYRGAFAHLDAATWLQELFQQMLQDWLKLPKGQRWPVHLKEHTTMFVYECSGLLFVAFTLENMQPLQVFEALRSITVFLQSAFGGLTEEKVRAVCSCLHNNVQHASCQCHDPSVPCAIQSSQLRMGNFAYWPRAAVPL